jgi:UDP-glucose 4-epimerase
MKIFITGSDGFIGKNIKEYLLKKKYKLIYPTFVELDLRDSKSVKEFFFKNYDIDYIVNCATTEQIDKNYDPKVIENNLRIFFNLINYKNKLTKLINLGSGSEYSRPHWKEKMRENYFGLFIPNDPHSFSKYIQSKYIKDGNYDNLYHLRLFGIFGKYEDYRYKFISNTIAKAINSIPIIINQNCIYDYVSIDDFVKILELFFKKKPEKNTFNITPTKSIDLISIAKIILKILKIDVDIKVLKDGYGREYSGDNSYLLKEFPKIKFTSYEKSIRILVSHIIKNKSFIDFKLLKEDNFLKYAKKIN